MTASTRSLRIVLSAALAAAVLMLGAQALALVNPNFTPKHVERTANAIFTFRVESVDADGKGATLAVGEIIKGKFAAKKLHLDLKAALEANKPEAKTDDFVGLLKSAGDQPALLAAGEYEGKACALVHIQSCWVRLNRGADEANWVFDCMDPSLNGTFNGGTDMLIETMKFIIKFPSAPAMPVDAGVRWVEHVKLAKLPGKAAALIPVDVNGDGALDLFAACSEGDRIFLQVKDGKFDEKALEPGSKSLAAAWADFDGDGRPDLASLGKDGLTLWLQKEPGKFSSAAVAGIGKLEAESPTVGVVDLEPDGRPDLVVGAGSPIVLKNDGKGGLSPVALPAADKKAADYGVAGPCVIADFDADGFADIVQTFQKNGLLWRGKAGGFAEPVECGAMMGKPKSRIACVADMDGDGLLDIFLIGGGATPHMLQNRGGFRFEETMRLTGEPGYIIQPGANCAALGDYNNDTFVDMFIGYAEEPAQSFFNRGFRSFAINEPLKLKEDDQPDCDKGQSAMVWADFRRGGTLDLAVALANGDVYTSRTTCGQMEQPVTLTVPFPKNSKSAAPLVVRFHLEGRCLGARVADRWTGPAMLGVSETSIYTVKYRPAGSQEITTQMEPGGKPTAENKSEPAKAKPPAATPQASPAGPASATPTQSGQRSLLFPVLIIGALIVVVVGIIVMVARKKQQ